MALKNLPHSIQTRRKIPNIYAYTRLMSLENTSSFLTDAINRKFDIDSKLGLPESSYTKNFRVSSRFSQVSVEILGNIHKIKTIDSYINPGTQLIYLYISTINSQGSTVIHRMRGSPKGPSFERLMNMQKGDLVLTHGEVHYKRQKLQDKLQYIYASSLSIFSAFKLNRSSLHIRNTYSSVMMLGMVIGKYVPIQGSSYVGQIDFFTWRKRDDNIYRVQYNRIMILSKILERSPFLENVNPGDTLMVDGSLDYITHPEVSGLILVVSAKEVIRLANVGSRYRIPEENASNIST
ncbi:hypothetical protein LOD99_5018 [Oopsacas minuta]|uniref:Uncharacterized protein n=1 Tax=Oopsacas minuta TaxID=111878 RepID=A0AAV7JSA9_9METZ|nr:hypothetical protein LOD99_5018 [Oopsacas minuta]